MELTTDEINALVWIALQGGERAIERDYEKYDVLTRRGLTEIIHQGNAYTTHKLTRAGIEAVLELPNDYRQGSYPLPRDIVRLYDTRTNPTNHPARPLEHLDRRSRPQN